MSATAVHPSINMLDKIGEGVSSETYAAHDSSTNEPIAIKMLRSNSSADVKEDFEREAVFLRELNHANFVRVNSCDLKRGWIVMELMQGSLDQKVLQASLFPQEVNNVLRQALNALQYLHERGRIHGEVKPANMLFDESGTIKFCDTSGQDADGEFRLPNDSQRHIAPEVLNPEEFGTPGLSVDLYCLGLSMLELLTGPEFVTLFKGVRNNSGNESMAWAKWHASASENLPPVETMVDNLPGNLANVINRLLKKHVDERYSSAAEALADLMVTSGVSREPQTNGLKKQASVPVSERSPTSVIRSPQRPKLGKREFNTSTNTRSGTLQDPKKVGEEKNPLAKRSIWIGSAVIVVLLLFMVAASAPKPAPLTVVKFIAQDENEEPVEATISIDGEPQGRTGSEIELAVGKYDVTATPSVGSPYISATESVEVSKSEKMMKVLVLKRRKPRIEVPRDVFVVISPRSESPMFSALEPLMWIDEHKCVNGQSEFQLRPGEHLLRIQLPGHEPFEEAITISAQEKTFKPILQRLQRMITVLVEPNDAKVFLAGKQLPEEGPFVVERPDGEYKIYATHPEFTALETVLTVRGDGTHRYTLERIAQQSIRFETDPVAATVYVNGEKLGQTPNRYSLNVGRHEVVLHKPGYMPVKSWINVNANQDFYFWNLNSAETQVVQ